MEALLSGVARFFVGWNKLFRRRLRWHAQGKCRTLANRTLQCHVAAKQARKPARNGQAQACASVGARRRRIRLYERLEQALLCGRRNADAGIDHLEYDPIAPGIALALRHQFDLAALSKLRRVRHQIEQALA